MQVLALEAELAPCVATETEECSPARCEQLGAVGGGAGAGGVVTAEAPLEQWLPDYKVFVYELPPEYHSDLKRDQKRCVNDQYGTEILIHENLLTVRVCNGWSLRPPCPHRPRSHTPHTLPRMARSVCACACFLGG